MADLGSDIAGVLDIGRALPTVSGRLALVQKVLRRVTTPRGGLLRAPTYGYDLRSLIGTSVLPSTVEQGISEQIGYEEEVERSSVTVTFSQGTLTVKIDLVDSDGPFELTLLLTSDLTVNVFLNGTQILQQAA